ncbi:TraR/DksA family transcriptional regulator [Streptomyces nigra]|uniref:TraR/DksA family transcriptional regulator n=1 Tax=Streptomyces nigra TaxID=1827580 RepID=UPI0036C15105
MQNGTAHADYARLGDLAQVRAELTARGEELRAELLAGEKEAADLRADCDLDAGDAGLRHASADQLQARERELGRLLEQTVAALERLDEGSYGICTSCGRPVDRERLDAIPHAARCMACGGQ